MPLDQLCSAIIVMWSVYNISHIWEGFFVLPRPDIVKQLWSSSLMLGVFCRVSGQVVICVMFPSLITHCAWFHIWFWLLNLMHIFLAGWMAKVFLLSWNSDHGWEMEKDRNSLILKPVSSLQLIQVWNLRSSQYVSMNSCFSSLWNSYALYFKVSGVWQIVIWPRKVN